MPQVYCHCCNKMTAHKVVMKRCEVERQSMVKNLACFFATVFQGAHYMKMEKQSFCRVCNTQAEIVESNGFSGAKVA